LKAKLPTIIAAYFPRNLPPKDVVVDAFAALNPAHAEENENFAGSEIMTIVLCISTESVGDFR
jgi:hypothetical protein